MKIGLTRMREKLLQQEQRGNDFITIETSEGRGYASGLHKFMIFCLVAFAIGYYSFYLTESSSTSKMSVLFGPMTPPAPRSP